MSRPILTVTKFEVIRQIKKPAFWIAILLMPVLIGGVFLISFLSGASVAEQEMAVDEDTKIAITDEAGILPEENPFALYENEELGKEAVKDGEIDLYYYIPADFTESKKVNLYRVSEGLDLFDNSAAVIKSILQQYVSARVAEVDAVVLTNGYEIEEVKFAADGGEANALGKAIIPLAILVVFFLFVCIFGNRLLMTVVEEKENRISEMILTAVSAKHLIIGKILAMMILGVIQILSFVLPVLAIVVLNRDNAMVSGVLSIIEIDPVTIVTNLILFVFSILLFAGFCTFIGTLVPTARDASQFIAPVIIGVMLPFYFMQTFMVQDVSLIVQVLTYFPLSAPTAMMLRNAFGTLTPVEFYIGLLEIIVLSVVVIWLTIRTFQKNAISFEIVKPRLLKKIK